MPLATNWIAVCAWATLEPRQVTCEAALFDRCGGMIHDSGLDITWRQDANWAKTSGYDGDGRMSWTAAWPGPPASNTADTRTGFCLQPSARSSAVG